MHGGTENSEIYVICLNNYLLGFICTDPEVGCPEDKELIFCALSEI